MKNSIVTNPARKWSRVIAFSAGGTFIATVGIKLIIMSQLGADALSTFILGLMQHFPLLFGTFSIMINSCILVLTYVKKREIIGVASVINSFGIGIFMNILDSLITVQAVPRAMGVPTVLLGAFLFALGTAIYLLADEGAGAYECLMTLIQDRFNLSVKTARIIQDGSFMLLGFLLGGPIGIGTILILALVGPMLDRLLQVLPKIGLTMKS